MKIPHDAPALFTLYLGLFSRHHSDNGPAIVEARRTDARHLVSLFFDGATFHDAVGSWKGETEPTLVVSILGTGADETKATMLARRMAISFAQDAVALSVSALASVSFVTARD